MGNFKPRGYGRRPRASVSRRPRMKREPVARLKPNGNEVVTIQFQIQGNHRAPDGNPYPKSRLTKGQQWTDEAKDYVAWKAYVAKAFLKALPPRLLSVCEKHYALGGKPIPSFFGEAHMSVHAQYKNGRHPDTENVFGSIADSIFEDDNGLSGAFSFTVRGATPGETTVRILMPDIF